MEDILPQKDGLLGRLVATINVLVMPVLTVWQSISAVVNYAIYFGNLTKLDFICNPMIQHD